MRLLNLNNYDDSSRSLALPVITEYSDYDFKNWTSLELLEDLFWESTFSAFTQDDYVNLLVDLSSYNSLRKQEVLFNQNHKSDLIDLKIKSSRFFKDLTFTTNFNTLPLFSEEGYTDLDLTPMKDFSIYDYAVDAEGSLDSYSNIKFLNYAYHSSYLNVLNSFILGNQPLSYTAVLNSFQSNYEENTLSYDEYTDVYDYATDHMNSTMNNDLRNSNPIKLRSTAKNSVVTFNALQKVFRPRFDEGRSNVRFSDLSNTFVKYPYLSESRIPYESMLSKNKESFFGVNSYKSNLSNSYNTLNPVFNSLNVYFSSLPFLNAMQSDAIRYLWFD